MAKKSQSRGRRSTAESADPISPSERNVETLAAILELFKGSGLRSLSFEDSDIIVQLEAHGAVVESAPAPARAAPPAAHSTLPAPHVPAGSGQTGHLITSPFVGTFYKSPNPTSPPFVAMGSVVKKGQTLCIIEAMKLMNEIEADEAGTIAEIYPENGAPVEFGQKLFRIVPA